MVESRSDVRVTTSSSPGEEDGAVSPLVHGYEQVLKTTYALPHVVMVPITYRRRGISRYINALPRPRYMLQFFVVDHARSSLGRARRRMLAAAALRTEPGAMGLRRESVGTYLESLPPTRRLLYSSSVLVLTVVLTQAVLMLAADAPRLLGDVGMDQVPLIEQILTAATTVNIASLDELFTALAAAPLRTTAFVLTSLSTALYLVLRPFVPAFRLKRAMFNLSPEPGAVLSTPARWSVPRATGLYELERRELRRLGAPPIREVPFDLIVSALLVPSVLFLGVMAFEAAKTSSRPEDPEFTVIMASAIVTAAIARLGWLARTWHRRQSNDATVYLPAEARIRGHRLILVLRDPATIAWATLIGGVVCLALSVTLAQVEFVPGPRVVALDIARFLILSFVIAPLWLRINLDVSAYLRARGSRRPGRPWVSALAVGSGWLFFVSETPLLAALSTGWVLVSAYRTAGRVRTAERLAGSGPPWLVPPWTLMILFPVFPLALALLQRAINRICWADCDVLE